MWNISVMLLRPFRSLKAFFVFYRRKKAIQVWNDMWVSKWWSFYILLFLYLSVSVSFDLTQIIPHAVFANFNFTLSIHISPSPCFSLQHSPSYLPFLPSLFSSSPCNFTILFWCPLLYFPIFLFPYLLVSFPISPHTFTHPLHPVSMIDFDWTAWSEGDCRSHPFYHRLLQTP